MKTVTDTSLRALGRATLGRIARAVLPVVVLMALSGCAVAGNTPSQPSDAKEKPMFLGTYLAAEYASANRDSSAAADYYLTTLKSDPDNMLLQQKVYAALISSGRFDEARPIADKLTAAESPSNLPQYFQILSQIKDGKYDVAQALLLKIPDTGFQALLNPLTRAWILAGKGQTEKAVAELDVLDQTPVFRPFRRNHRALIYAYSGNKTAAQIAFKESLSLDPRGSLRIILAYGRFLADIGRAYEAKQLFEEYRRLYPDDQIFANAERELGSSKTKKPLIASPADALAEALFSMASALAVDNANGPAAYYLHLATYLKPNFSDAYLLLGRLLELDSALEPALAAYDHVPVGDVLRPEAALRKAWVLDQLKRPAEALAILDELVKSDPTSVALQLSLGDWLRAHDKQEQAIEAYSAALRLSSPEAKAAWPIYYSRGTSYEKLKRWPEAEADFLKALELNPDQPQVLNYLGYSWIERGINLAKAQAMLERAVELSPNDAFIADSLGWALYRQKKYTEAVVLLERAVLQQPEDPTLNDHLGDAYWSAGRRREARFQWRHALSLGAVPEEAAKIQAKVDKGPAARGAASKNGVTPKP